MATLECDHETVAGVTLVECRLASDAPQRVTVEPTHDGPIWPPRRQGVVEPGWSDDGWTGVVPADGVRALGYATPAETADVPVQITATAPPDGDESVTARDVIRALGDPTPARDAVPVPAREPVTESLSKSATETVTESDSETVSEPASVVPGGDERAGTDRDRDRSQPAGQIDEPADDARARTATEAELDAVETRLWTARDLAGISSVEEARAAVDRAGGMGAVRSLATQLEADRDRLADLEERTARLASEVEAVEVPLPSLERLV